MAQCESFRLRVMLHLDDELDADERRLVDAHLKTCASCRGAFRRERLFREGIRRRRPLHVVSEELRASVASLVDTRPPPAETSQRARFLSPRVAKRLRAYSAAVVIAGLVGFMGVQHMSDVVVPRAVAANFPAMAVDVHKRHQRGQLPLEMRTDAAGDIARWFSGKVPFVVTLPDYQGTSGQENRYEIKGARLVGFDGDYAAYVAYRMDRQPISLVITSTSVARPAGGETISEKDIEFHFQTIDGLKVVTWTHRTLTYALVSKLEERGVRSCMVCHQAASDRNFIEKLARSNRAPAAAAGSLQPVR